MAAGDPGTRKRNYSAVAIETSLSSPISSAATGDTTTSVAVVSVSGFPSVYPYTLIIAPDTSKEEVVTVTAGASTILTIVRGQDGTPAFAHSAGEAVRHGISAREFKELQTHISARGYDTDSAILANVDTHVHGIVTGEGDVVGTLKTQTLSNKTLGSDLSAGTYKITNLGTPTLGTDAVTKTYADATIAAAATSAASAATSASSALTSATSAATSATSAATSATSSNSSFVSMDQKYLGSKTTAPTLNNQGGALATGATYWNSTSSVLFYWTGSAWTNTALPSQTGNSGKFLTTNGSASSWAWSAYQGGGSIASNLAVDASGTALDSNTTGANNIAIGVSSLTANTLGVRNVAIGVDTLKTATTNTDNVAIGYQALTLASNATTGSVGIGTGALSNLNFNGHSNVAVGYNAGLAVNTGTQNTLIGHRAGWNLQSGSTNTFIGFEAGGAGSAASNCIAIGNTAGNSLQANGIIAIGANAMQYPSGVDNIAIGTSAASVMTTGANNVVIGGNSAGGLTTGSNNTVLGAGATASAVSVSNEVTLGNSSITSFRIPGLSITASVNDFKVAGAIRTTAPVTKTGAFTLAATENYITCNGTATFAVTLGTGTAGRVVVIRNIAAFTVTSASSNVYPINSATLGTAILPATAGSWVTLVGDGTNWVTMQS
jgi:hypothetical protein